MKYYIDTSIWRDLHEDRKDRFRPLGDWAFELFRKIRENNEIVVFSDLIVDELSKDYDTGTIRNIFTIASGNLEKAKITKHQVIEAKNQRKLFSVPFGDILHSIIARDNNAIIVTRDHHFEELQHIVDVKKPEELI
jgi:predicted nucleic acid-binding protein